MRYAANLLLEYGVDGAPSARPLCERRVVTFEARGAVEAIRRAKQHGRRAQHSYRNADGGMCRIRFVGLIDVISLESCDDNEVYYSLRRISRPLEHVCPDHSLSVVRPAPKTISSSWWAVPASVVRRGVPRPLKTKSTRGA